VNYYQLVTAVQDYTENTFSSVDINTFIEQAEQRIYNDIQFPSLRKNVTGTVNPNTAYLSAPSDYLSTYSLAVYSTAVTFASGTAGLNTINVQSATAIAVGQNVSGLGIGAGAIVIGVSGTAVVLSVVNTSNLSLTQVNFQGPYQYLLNKDVNFIREAFPYPGVTGFPTHYAIFGPTVAGGAPTNELSFLLGPTPDLTYGTELHYYYYPPSIIPGVITALNLSFTAGAGYIDGTYYNQALTGGTGSGASATIVVAKGVVTTATIETGGSGYVVGDSLSIGLSNGSGFAITVSNVNQTTGQTWLGDNYDAAILYGTLVEAITFMKGEQDLVQLYDGKYKEALGQAKRLGDGLERQDAYRSGQYRQKVT
jgi:hypothetical protein